MVTKLPDHHSEMLIYQTEDGQTRIGVRLEDETVWLTQATIAQLFQTTVANINIHVGNILEEGELDEETTIKDYLIVQQEGQREVSRQVKHYNLKMILAIGYRVRSHVGTQFRRWATKRLDEYLVKGFVMDDERLKEGRNLGADYFEELLERIRDIRASEKRFYRKILDLFTLSVDYEPKAGETQGFFATIQNKLHWATSGSTAAELIAERADATKPNMGLTTWKGAKVRKSDVIVAKNYLSQKEIRELNRIVTMYLDYAEDQAQRHQPIYMQDWINKLNTFLKFNERDILENPGSVSMEIAKELAREHYDEFNRLRIAEVDQLADDLDGEAKRLKGE
jgi:hypothetical protein